MVVVFVSFTFIFLIFNATRREGKHIHISKIN